MFKSKLPIIILVFSILYIFFIPNEPIGFKLFFKLIPMILIIIQAIKQMPAQKSRIHWFILTGLIFSAIGDGALIWFIVGLSAFLIGHIFYIIGFSNAIKPTPLRMGSLVILLPYMGWFGYQLVSHLLSANQTGLLIPVMIYIGAIGLMGFIAILTGNIFAIFGSVLFIISDSILAWNMFIDPIIYSGVFIMSTYYTAQFLIATSLKTIKI